MLVLGIDSSAITASCAVCEIGENEKVIAGAKINNKITHSQTLVPIIEDMLKNADIKLSDIDLFAAANGPGSFTGLRIGVSAIKGMAFALGKKTVGVSTLEALAHNLIQTDCIACAVMDARCNQFYNALFRIKDAKTERLCDDRALFTEELYDELQKFSEKIIFVGDGAELAMKKIKLENTALAVPSQRFQSAESVCFAAASYEPIDAVALMPSYLRLPQAERERLEKNREKGIKE